MLAGAVEKSALAQPGFLVQTVRIPAVLVHCHWPFSITLVNGLGRVNSTEANAAAPARAIATMARRAAFRVQEVFIGFTSHGGAPRIRTSDSLLCERCHNFMIVIATATSVDGIVIGS
jgi:hypothetical protein